MRVGGLFARTDESPLQATFFASYIARLPYVTFSAFSEENMGPISFGFLAIINNGGVIIIAGVRTPLQLQTVSDKSYVPVC